MTSGVQAAKGAIRNCARLISEHELGDKARLYDMADSLCDILRELPDESLSNPETFQALVDKINEGGCGRIRDGEIEPPCSEKEYALRIIHDAQLMEGSKTTLGVHAAGVIIADNGDVGEYIPLMKSKEGLWVSQCDMGYTENKGLLKMDFLGLRNLSIITDTLRSVEKNTGEQVRIEDVPLDDKAVYSEIFSKGRTDSVFQFESQGMKEMLTKFKPETIEEVILLVAAYRPKERLGI